LLGDGHLAHAGGEIVHFLDGLAADGEHVHAAELEDEPDGFVAFVGVVAQAAFADEFHSDDALAGGLDLAQDGHDFGGWAVHAHLEGVDAGVDGVHPGLACGGLEGLEGVAGDAVGADDAFLFEFGQDFHLAAQFRGPVG